LAATIVLIVQENDTKAYHTEYGVLHLKSDPVPKEIRIAGKDIIMHNNQHILLITHTLYLPLPAHTCGIRVYMSLRLPSVLQQTLRM
jgi:hypothetical protein